jgi:hypothetical protein
MSWRIDVCRGFVLFSLGWWVAPVHAADTQAGAVADDGRERIVLIGTVEDYGFVGRVAAELHAVNLDRELRVAEVARGDLDREIDMALRSQARAVMRADSQLGRIDILMVDSVTQQVALRISLNGSPIPDAEPLLALRAVELVRASLLGQPPALPALTAEMIPNAQPERSAVSAVVSSGFSFAQGGLGPQGELGLQLHARSRRSLGFNLLILAPLTTARVQGMAATNTEASIWLGGGDIFVRHGLGRTTTLDAGVGGLVVAMRVSGQPSAGWMGGTTTGYGGGGYFRVGGSVALSRSLALRADLLVGGVLRRPVASAGGPTDYPWGYSFGVAAAGIEARLF